ncbi:mammalian cell entry protein [Hymenobacter amundsenii]|uniref:Mammalian cell entry protein n=1 Tax=Hymenobacter amundsenii TaxID=2006685 RepID=A0A246FIF0_9BACT|nr:MlaD family protein [Hymenobacter amundsenii]OWP62301.1 mammalian cell entry protein [Hymenobacter amundsenii]
MPADSTRNNVRLGLFVMAGLGCVLFVLFLLGRQQNLFSHSMMVRADFRTVAGLLTGNNVRLGGITVGTVKKISILNDTTVRVEMNLNSDVRAFVRKNAVAAIGTDGLVGNTIINLNARPGPAAPVQPGDILQTATPPGLDAMLGTLEKSNKNLVGITKGLREITDKINGSEALWKLLSNEELAANVSQSARGAALTSARLATAAQDVQQLTHDAKQLARGIQQGRGPLGYLLTDQDFAGQVDHAARQLAGTSDTLAATLTDLQRQVQSGAGPLNTLLADTAAARQVRLSLRNVQQSTASLRQSMEALQHNFLLRGYFRRQEKKKRKAQQKQAERQEERQQAQAAQQETPTPPKPPAD